MSETPPSPAPAPFDPDEATLPSRPRDADAPGSGSGSAAVKFRSKERDLSGTQLGEYQLVRKIAEGGMGEVYEAVQLKLDRRVAVKLLSEELSREPEFLARFEREAKSAAALNHANVVQVYDYGSADGQFYFVMELVDGVDLSQHVKEHGRVPIPEALGYFEQAVNALKFAARHAIIHRDVKPANLMLTRDGTVKVADLGLAKKLTDDSDVTMTGVGMGSPHFLAPEQADDAAHVDHRADIYSLGVTLLFLLTGKRPYEGASNFSVVLAHANKPLPTGFELGTPLPEEIERFIKRMTAKHPAARYQNYEELLADLQRVKAGHRPRVNVAQLFKHPRALQYGVSACAVVLLLALGVPLLWPDKKLISAATTQTEPPRDDRRPPDDRPPDDQPPRPGEPRGKGKGPEGRGIRLPWPRRAEPDRSPLRDGSIPQMLAEADAFAATNKTDYVNIVHRYGQIELKAVSTQWEAEAIRRFELAVRQMEAAAAAGIKQFETRMEPLLAARKFDEAYELWRDFPPSLQTRESDMEIQDLLRRRLPPDFQPR